MRMNLRRQSRSDLLSRTEAWQVLEPIAQRFYGWLEDSWEWVQALLDEDAERRAILDPSTVAAMVYDRFKSAMKSGLHDESDIELVDNGRMTRAFVHGKMFIRFKKLDEKLRSKNISTTNQESIYYQQYALKGTPAQPTNITFGYVTDLSGTTITGAYFTCPKDWEGNHWIIKIGGASEEHALLFDPHGFDDGPAETRLVSKKSIREKA